MWQFFVMKRHILLHVVTTNNTGRVLCLDYTYFFLKFSNKTPFIIKKRIILVWIFMQINYLPPQMTYNRTNIHSLIWLTLLWHIVLYFTKFVLSWNDNISFVQAILLAPKYGALSGLCLRYSRQALDLRNVVACNYVGRLMSQHILP